jgi:hypothetical protein
MDADERDICNYLKTFPGQFVSAREISRRAGGKRRFREEPNWAYPVLSRMVEKAFIETDSTRHYRLPFAETKKDKNKKWISPQIRKLLERNKNVEHIVEYTIDDGTDEAEPTGKTSS